MNRKKKEYKKTISEPLNNIVENFSILESSLLNSKEYAALIPDSLKQLILKMHDQFVEITEDYAFNNLTEIYNAPPINMIEFAKTKKFNDINLEIVELTTL